MNYIYIILSYSMIINPHANRRGLLSETFQIHHIYIMRSRLHNSFMTRGDNDQLSTYIGGQTVRRIKNDKQKWKTNKVVNEVH